MATTKYLVLILLTSISSSLAIIHRASSCFNLPVYLNTDKNTTKYSYQFSDIPSSVNIMLKCDHPDKRITILYVTYSIPKSIDQYCIDQNLTCTKQQPCTCCSKPAASKLCEVHFDAANIGIDNSDCDGQQCLLKMEKRYLFANVCSRLDYRCIGDRCLSRWVEIDYRCAKEAGYYFQIDNAKLVKVICIALVIDIFLIAIIYVCWRKNSQSNTKEVPLISEPRASENKEQTFTGVPQMSENNTQSLVNEHQTSMNNEQTEPYESIRESHIGLLVACRRETKTEPEYEPIEGNTVTTSLLSKDPYKVTDYENTQPGPEDNKHKYTDIIGIHEMAQSYDYVEHKPNSKGYIHGNGEQDIKNDESVPSSSTINPHDDSDSLYIKENDIYGKSIPTDVGIESVESSTVNQQHKPNSKGYIHGNGEQDIKNDESVPSTSTINPHDDSDSLYIKENDIYGKSIPTDVGIESVESSTVNQQHKYNNKGYLCSNGEQDIKNDESVPSTSTINPHDDSDSLYIKENDIYGKSIPYEGNLISNYVGYEYIKTNQIGKDQTTISVDPIIGNAFEDNGAGSKGYANVERNKTTGSNEQKSSSSKQRNVVECSTGSQLSLPDSEGSCSLNENVTFTYKDKVIGSEENDPDSKGMYESLNETDQENTNSQLYEEMI